MLLWSSITVCVYICNNNAHDACEYAYMYLLTRCLASANIPHRIVHFEIKLLIFRNLILRNPRFVQYCVTVSKYPTRNKKDISL